MTSPQAARRDEARKTRERLIPTVREAACRERGDKVSRGKHTFKQAHTHIYASINQQQAMDPAGQSILLLVKRGRWHEDDLIRPQKNKMT